MRRRSVVGFLPGLILLIISGMFFSACLPEKFHKTLVFFFDGVPEQNFENDSTLFLAISDSDTAKSFTTRTQISKPVIYLHPPFGERACLTCHEEGLRGKLTEDMPNLCFKCHTDFGTEYEWVHGPTAAGACTECHSPHKSKLENLALRSGQELCYYCHESSDVLSNSIHGDIGEGTCTECHNPHGGENKALLKNTAHDISCYNCHDDFRKQYTWVHGPVAAGACYECHGTHSTKTRNLLTNSGQDICFYCHEKKDVLKNEVHEGLGTTNCTECHNPHGGDDRFLFPTTTVVNIAPVVNTDTLPIKDTSKAIIATTDTLPGIKDTSQIKPIIADTFPTVIDSTLIMSVSIDTVDAKNDTIKTTALISDTIIAIKDSIQFAPISTDTLEIVHDTLRITPIVSDTIIPIKDTAQTVPVSTDTLDILHDTIQITTLISDTVVVSQDTAQTIPLNTDTPDLVHDTLQFTPIVTDTLIPVKDTLQTKPLYNDTTDALQDTVHIKISDQDIKPEFGNTIQLDTLIDSGTTDSLMVFDISTFNGKPMAFYYNGSSIASSVNTPLVSGLIALLEKNPELKVIVIGYTSSTGTDSINTILSLDRAINFKDILTAKGISIERIRVEGRSKEKPIANEDSEEGKAMNRRVEVEVYK